MDKYKINYIFNSENDINDILISVLNKKLKKHVETFLKNRKYELLSSLKKDRNY